MEHTYVSPTHCKDCRKTYDAKRWKSVKDSRREQKRAQRIRVKEEIQSLKNQPCLECKTEYHHAAMGWHHIDPTTKLFNIADAINSGCRKKLLDEIAKCELLCANCHAVRTWQDRQSVV